MANCNVQTLLNNAACFACLPPGTLAIVELQLLCEILNSSASGGGGGVLNGVVDPNGVVTGTSTATTTQIYINTALGKQWVFEGVSGANTGWVQFI